MNRTLFDISDDLLAIDELLDELGGDVTDPEIEQKIDAWFEQATADRDQKTDNYAALIRELETRSKARKAEADRLAERARIDAEKAAYLTHRLQSFFELHQIKKIETARFRVSLATHGGRLPLVVLVDDPEDLPEPFRREIVRVKPDNDAIRQALDAGEQLDFARYGERGQSIRIR